jgi:alpha-L-rhamnosidase
MGHAQEVTNLRVESATNPLGIDKQHPALSWMIATNKKDIEQIGYQVLVASSPKKLTPDDADLWNSGKVKSDQSVFVHYNGDSIKSGQQCFWKVKVWTNKGESDWSPFAKWSMGLPDKSDWKGDWIGLTKFFPGDTLATHSRLAARYFRKVFTPIKRIHKATAYIVGIGMYEMFINGQKIGNQVLSPGPTDFTKNVRYNTFDVTLNLKKGKNVIGTILGNGRYFYMRQGHGFQQSKEKLPKMLFQLDIEYADGSHSMVVSDDSWKVTPGGPIRSNNEYDGEEYDARMELTGWTKTGYNDSNWLDVELVTAPCETILSQTNENMIVHEVVKPVSINQLPNGNYILDMGQNMAGWLKFKAKGAKGDTITMRFAETLKQDGTLYTANLRSALQTDRYVMKGQGWEQWEPAFVYHGFRNVEVSGFPGKPKLDDFEGKVIYDGFQTIGSFSCSDTLLNLIYTNACRTIQNNYKGMPVDCPQRDERDPWLADWATTSLGASYTFDIERLYVKWMDDMQFSQRSRGQMPDVAPEPGWTGIKDNMTWPGTYLMIGNMLLTQFGNTGVIAKHYPAMRDWMWYMKKKYLKDYILDRDRFGDWCVPPESLELVHSKDPARNTDGALIGTAYFYHYLQMMSIFANVSGNIGDIEEYQRLAEKVRKAFNVKFFDVARFRYGNNTVTANLLPLAFGMVDKDVENIVFNQMVHRIITQDNSHISTGLIGTQWLMRELTKRGRADLAFAIATQKDYPSWGYMIEKGATTIWELWNGDTADPSMNSRNHVMLLGDLIAWMYQDLAGLKSMDSYYGFKQLWMAPQIVGGLSSAKASTNTPYGEAESDWTLKDGQFIWNVTIPANTEADVLVPAESVEHITESGNPVTKLDEVKYVGKTDGRVHLEIGSGSYTFVCKYNRTNNY